MIETRKREHSRKPDEQYALIESCSPGAYLEMFARHARPSWTVWGDESSDEVTPRGTVHKGYAGGTILPPLLPNEHVDIARAGILGDQLRSMYQAGKSVRQLSDETGYSIQRIRALLQGAGTNMRPRDFAYMVGEYRSFSDYRIRLAIPCVLSRGNDQKWAYPSHRRTLSAAFSGLVVVEAQDL
jgi:hypothetical protein